VSLTEFPYILFLVTLVLLAALLRSGAVPVLMLGASLFFYAWGDLTKIPILVFIIACAYYGAIDLEKPRSRSRLWIWLAVTFLPLLFFKYYGVLGELEQSVFQMVGFSNRRLATGALPPVGISFYTFQAAGYLIDVYRRNASPEKSLGRVALFLSFFPLVLAGPIERSGHLLPQLRLFHGSWKHQSDLVGGCYLILKGILIKLVFADNFAGFVDNVYSSLAAQSPANAVMASYLYSAQIYCDFYGYTLIALGSAALFGINLVNNFQHPYLASSIQQFWRRWHISLTTWLRDYVYFSLGGLRKPVNRYRNIFITMLVCGAWHGAGLKFLLWGGVHGMALMLNRLYETATVGILSLIRPAFRVALRPLGVLLTFHFVTLAWVLFRADSLNVAWTMIRKIVRAVHAPGVLDQPFWVFYARLGCAFVLFEVLDYLIDFETLFRRCPAPLKILWIFAFYCALYFAPLKGMRFVYFQF
jgi:alginate O-acetyltransferase complex protein AlgI